MLHKFVLHTRLGRLPKLSTILVIFIATQNCFAISVAESNEILGIKPSPVTSYYDLQGNWIMNDIDPIEVRENPAYRTDLRSFTRGPIADFSDLFPSGVAGTKNSGFDSTPERRMAKVPRTTFENGKDHPGFILTANDLVTQRAQKLVELLEEFGVVARKNYGSEIANPYFETNTNSLHLDLEYYNILALKSTLLTNPNYLGSPAKINKFFEAFAAQYGLSVKPASKSRPIVEFLSEDAFNDALNKMRIEIRLGLMQVAVGERMNHRSFLAIKLSELLASAQPNINFSKSVELRLAAIVASKVRYHNFKGIIKVLGSMKASKLSLMTEMLLGLKANEMFSRDEKLEKFILELTSRFTNISKVEFGYETERGVLANSGLPKQTYTIVRVLNLYTISEKVDAKVLGQWLSIERNKQVSEQDNATLIGRRLNLDSVPWSWQDRTREDFIRRGGAFGELISLSSDSQQIIVEKAFQKKILGLNLLVAPTRIISMDEPSSAGRKSAEKNLGQGNYCREVIAVQ